MRGTVVKRKLYPHMFTATTRFITDGLTASLLLHLIPYVIFKVQITKLRQGSVAQCPFYFHIKREL